MAIYLVEGKIGSGKTYFCVHSLSKKYYDWDELLNEFISKRNITIITNVDGLKLDHVSLQHEIDVRGLSGVFSETYINELRQQSSARNIIFIIDEAQKYFDRKFYNKDIFYFFQYSRHLGVDIYFITQDVDSLARELRNLSEYVIHSVSRSNTSGTSFAYKFISNDEVFKTVIVPFDKKVFKLYRSFNFDELEKPRPIIYRFIGIFVICLVLVVLLFYFLFVPTFMGKSKKVAANPKESKVIQKSKVLLPPESVKEIKKVNFKEVAGSGLAPPSSSVATGYLLVGNTQYVLSEDERGRSVITKTKIKVLTPESLVINKITIPEGVYIGKVHFNSGEPLVTLLGAAQPNSQASAQAAPPLSVPVPSIPNISGTKN